MRVRTMLTAAAVAALAGGPAGALETPAVDLDPSGSRAAAADTGVEVVDNAFEPAEVTVDVGDTVTWTQSGSNPHSVTADDGSFDAHPNCPPACMAPGGTFERTFETAGTFAYYCRVHGGPGGAGMSGAITVQASGGATQAPSSPGGADTAGAADTSGAVSGSALSSDGAAAAPVSGSTDPLPRSGGPGVSGALGFAMLGVATVARWLAVGRQHMRGGGVGT